MKQEITAVFDIGKTNKKLFLFDHDLHELAHEYVSFDEVLDDDGEPCENLEGLIHWIKSKVKELSNHSQHQLKNLNFSTYGASLVHMKKNGEPATPFYNYLKEYPKGLEEQFFETHGDKNSFAVATASPIMGFLNSGFQLYYLKHCKPKFFDQIQKSYHFPQYLSALFTGQHLTDYTSLGCHTCMWNFSKDFFHEWMLKEGINCIHSEVVHASHRSAQNINGQSVNVGIGVHDSSAALVPYLFSNQEPFILMSTGTWSISLNYFNRSPLTADEFSKDCLNYMSIKGTPVKASRLFLGKEFSHQVKKISAYFNRDNKSYRTLSFDPAFYKKGHKKQGLVFKYDFLQPDRLGFTPSKYTDLSMFNSFEEAYYSLLDELTDIQIASLKLAVGQTKIDKIYVDGGFSSNGVFLNYLALKLPEYRIFSTSFTLGTALGAAMMVNFRNFTTNFLREHYNILEYKPIKG